jgi:hypothetical protein
MPTIDFLDMRNHTTFQNKFLLRKNHTRAIPITTEMIRMKKNAPSAAAKGNFTFIPKKLATRVGTIRAMVTIVSLWIKTFRLFEIIEA